MVSMGQKDIIFGVIESSIGMATAVSFSAMVSICSTNAYNALIHYGCLSGLVPILMRWSLKFWQGGSLAKIPELVTCIWAISCYLLGGVMIIVCLLDSDSNAVVPYISASFAIIVGVVTLIDLILGLKGK